MGRIDPFSGYSALLRVVVYGFVPLFAAWQFVRLRRALHVFQLEGYKRSRFLRWCRANPRRALFLARAAAKKPLVMTPRAWRLLVVATLLSVVVVLGPAAAAHLAGGAPYDLVTWAGATVIAFAGMPALLVGADLFLGPLQRVVNARFLTAASHKLDDVGATVIGVTGSFGKTSTKFAIGTILGSDRRVLVTPGSYNTPLGVCRAINEELDRAHEFFVVEMGAYREGEIAALAAFVAPRIGVLTAIGPAHLERFGSLAAIRRAKYELIEALPGDGVAVVNSDDPEVRALADATAHVRVVRYGLDPSGGPDVTAYDVRVDRDGTSFRLVDHGHDLSVDSHTRVLGRHALGHVLAGVAVRRETGSLTGVEDAIARIEPVAHRLQVLDGDGGITVIDDAYNSNPDGAEAALEVLDEMPGNKKVVVTPGMIELGPLQFDANERFGARAAAVADVVIVVAKVNRDAIVAGAETASNGARVVVVDSLAAATDRLSGLLEPGDVVLFENDLPDQYEG